MVNSPSYRYAVTGTGGLVLIGLCLLAFSRPFVSPPPLHIEKERLLTENEEVSLIGVTSDYFRVGYNRDYPERYGGLNKELERIDSLLKSAPAINLSVLYLTDLRSYPAKLKELDRYLKSLKERGLYVLLAPVGHNFLETNPQEPNTNNLTEFLTFLTSRYGKEPHILFQTAAEPSLEPEVWDSMQRNLVKLMRQNTANPIVISTPFYHPYEINLDYEDPQIIYSIGGYIGQSTSAPAERKVAAITAHPEIGTHPVLLVEFGGFYLSDFSSPEDLWYFEQILRKAREDKLSYSTYRLSSSYANDPQALYTTKNHLTARGQIFVDSFNK